MFKVMWSIQAPNVIAVSLGILHRTKLKFGEFTAAPCGYLGIFLAARGLFVLRHPRQMEKELDSQ